ncbi:MAG TPA: SDR family oxidoreductase [Solirubrobacteraceae bacterium]|jgi:NAD(P)-dependent dehydrogenase (short-subunit alcohol dehydrogenase family)|nr:SDR family oxidoreductase [Solirubrobacteraceae bacterium]
MELTDKVAIVTGASSGIGQATARRLAGEGARLVLAARRTERIQALAAELGQARAVTTDMRDPAQVRALVAAATDAYGGVDVLVNNAGQGLHVPVMDIALDDLEAVTELNFYAPLVAMQAVAPIMRKRGGGSIVNVSSGTTLMLPTGTAGYAATKAALNMLSRTARAELADDGITVSIVYPFLTATEFHETLRAGAGARRRPGLEPHSPELVADAIAQLIQSGGEQAVLVPEQLRVSPS